MIAKTTLPTHDEMLDRLKSVDADPHMIERFYPLLLTKAGQEQTGIGLAITLQLAITDYTNNMPPILAKVLQMRLPQFVEAIIEDPQTRADALTALDAN